MGQVRRILEAQTENFCSTKTLCLLPLLLLRSVPSARHGQGCQLAKRSPRKGAWHFPLVQISESQGWLWLISLGWHPCPYVRQHKLSGNWEPHLEIHSCGGEEAQFPKRRTVLFSEERRCDGQPEQEVFLLLEGKRTALAGCRERDRCEEHWIRGTECRMRRSFVLVK